MPAAKQKMAPNLNRAQSWTCLDQSPMTRKAIINTLSIGPIIYTNNWMNASSIILNSLHHHYRKNLKIFPIIIGNVLKCKLQLTFLIQSNQIISLYTLWLV